MWRSSQTYDFFIGVESHETEANTAFGVILYGTFSANELVVFLINDHSLN